MPVVGTAADLDGQQCPGGVLAGVGDALLDDPVERPADHIRHRLGRVDAVGVVDVEPGLPGLLDQAGQVGVRRLRAVRAARRSGRRAARRALRAGRSAPRAPSPGSRAALSRISSASRSVRNASAPACIEIWEIRWASTSCISRAITRAFGGAGLAHPQLLLGLGPLGAVAQGPEQLAARPDVHAPGGDRGHEDDVEAEVSATPGRPTRLADRAKTRAPARLSSASGTI